MTTMLVTHDQEEALSLADRVMVLNNDVVQQLSTPEQAYLQPANRFVAEFLGTANIVSTDGGRQGVVRPERVLLTQTVSPDCLRGTVEETVYLGQSVRYHVQADDGSKFVCTMPFGGTRFAVNTPVAMSWSASDVWFLE